MTILIPAATLAAVLIAASMHRRNALFRRQLGAIAAGIDGLRKLAAGEPDYRPAAPGDIPEEDQATFDSVARELEQQRCTLLGDLLESAEGHRGGVTRWFVDSTGTVCGWFGVSHPKDAIPSPAQLLFGETGSGSFVVTGRGGTSTGLATPPNLQREFDDWDEGLGRTLDRHRAQVARVAKPGEGPARRIETLDDAHALLRRLRENSRKWRAAQRPAELLQQDVRAVLRDRYDELGASLIAYMSRPR